MISDMMDILPLKVWFFWMFVINIGFIIFAIKAYRQLLTDNRGLASLITLKVNNNEPV